MDFQRIAGWVICAYVIYVVFFTFTVGCGHSDEGIPNAPIANPPIESVQGPVSMSRQSETFQLTQGELSSGEPRMPVSTAAMGSAAIVCSAAVPLIVVAMLAWQRPHARRVPPLGQTRDASVVPVKRLARR